MAKTKVSKSPSNTNISYNLRSRVQKIQPKSQIISKAKAAPKLSKQTEKIVTVPSRNGFSPPTWSRCEAKKPGKSEIVSLPTPARIPRPVLVASRCQSSHSLQGDKEVPYNPVRRFPKSTFADLQGIDEIKANLIDMVVRPFVNPANADILKIEVPQGILLTGKPGTGKTALADAIVTEIRRRKGTPVDYFAEHGNCLSEFVGESERHLRELFKIAKASAPSVIFLDELDGLGGKRRNHKQGCEMNTIITTLLTEMNDVPRGLVLVLAATNIPQNCDEALIRPGRFDLTFNIPMPDFQARSKILQFYFDKKEIKLGTKNMNDLSTKTEGFAGSSLKTLVEGVNANIVQRTFAKKKCDWEDLNENELVKIRENSLVKLEMGRDVWPALKVMIDAINAMKENRD